MDVYVVYDLKGAGRVVGVFRHAERARRVVAINPAYYKLTFCRLDEISDVAFAWLAAPEQREALAGVRRIR